VLDAAKSLFFCGGDELAVRDESRGRVGVVGVNS
jgi:hypothetical protein